MLGDEGWSGWLEKFGITTRDARRYANFPAQTEVKTTQVKIEAQHRRCGANASRLPPPDTLPTSLGAARTTLEKMGREVDRVPLAELARIERVAEAMRFLFWDALDIREVALDLALRAKARLRDHGMLAAD